jgi:hypothetical protein
VSYPFILFQRNQTKINFISSLVIIYGLATTKSGILMLMTASFVCGILALFMSIMTHLPAIIAIPGFVVGVFFAFKYAKYTTATTGEEEQNKRRRRARRH